MPQSSRLPVPLTFEGARDTSIQDVSYKTAEQGLTSISEVPEEALLDLPSQRHARSHEKPISRRRPRSSSRSSRESNKFSVGSLLGHLVRGIIKSLLMIVKLSLSLVTGLFFVCGRILGIIYDGAFIRPVLWLRSSNLSVVVILTIGALLFGVWYGLVETDSKSLFPSLSLFRPSSRPIFVPPEAPAGDITELAERLQRLERALSGLLQDSEQTRGKTEDSARSHLELMDRLGALESRVTAESRRLVESEVKIKDALLLGRNVNSVKLDIESLEMQLKAQERQRQQEHRQHRVEHISDEEARVKLRALEDRIGGIEGGVKEAIELGKKAISTSVNTKIPTVRVPGGQDLKSFVTEIVDDAISLFSKDTIARTDYAMHSSGARVIPSLTSTSFDLQPRDLKGQILGFFSGYGSAVGRPPVTALHHESHSGYCWPFAGSQGQLGVSLAAPVIIDEVTIDHVAKEVALDVGSAPRRCEVWGMVEGEENAKKYQEVIEARKKVAGPREIEEGSAEEEYPQTLIHDPPFLRIANFTYDIAATKNVQTFIVDEDVKEKKMDFGIVVLRVLDNWGMEAYTCLYRFRVHGERLVLMQIPGPVEDVGL